MARCLPHAASLLDGENINLGELAEEAWPGSKYWGTDDVGAENQKKTTTSGDVLSIPHTWKF